MNKSKTKFYLAVLLLGVPALLFSAFYGGSSLDWDRMVRTFRHKFA